MQASETKLIAVTGTNGKTTTAHIITHILRHSGYKTACIGTLGADFDGTYHPTGYTTPPREILSELISRAETEKYDFVVLEVSSHALAQKRTEGLRFIVGAFLNLTHDHLDYHETMENYADAKASLFESCETAVLNLDDPYARTMAWRAKSVCYFGHSEESDFIITDIRQNASGSSFNLRNGTFGALPVRVSVSMPLIGDFNIINASAAVCCCLLSGIPAPVIETALPRIPKVRGRMERLSYNGSPDIIIDYAHTPDALEKTLSALKGTTYGRLITVFGCGGDRDRAKRPEMARVSAKYSDISVVTSDNPRSEPPEDIINEIIRGFPQDARFTVVCDREKAIRYALGQARREDTVLLAGKGHEDYIEDSSGRHFFSERVIAETFYK